jgi:hypothetical protein
MVCFQTKNTNLGKFWRVLEWNKIDIFYIHLEYLKEFGIFYDHLVHFVFIWYIFSRFGIMDQKKSGNPATTTHTSQHNKTSLTLLKSHMRDRAKWGRGGGGSHDDSSHSHALRELEFVGAYIGDYYSLFFLLYLPLVK